MGIYIDDEWMMMEEVGEMDSLYREKERRTRVTEERESAAIVKNRENNTGNQEPRGRVRPR